MGGILDKGAARAKVHKLIFLQEWSITVDKLESISGSWNGRIRKIPQY